MDNEREINQLKEKLEALSKSFLQVQKNQVPVTARTDESFNKIPQVDTNTQDILTNSEDILTTQEGLAQTYEETQTNATDILATQEGLAETYEETYTSITNCEEALAELYEMIIPTT